MTKRFACPSVFAVLLLLIAVPAPVAAQGLSIGGSDSNFGTRSIAPGFTPDPLQIAITSGGDLSVPKMNLAEGCVGFATSTPDYIIQITGAMDFLSFFNEGDGDTGLVINDPNGTWFCDDDSHTDTNPKVSLSNAQPGQYDIWVTSYTASENISGTLYVTELRSTASSGMEDSDVLSIGGSSSNFGSTSIAPGFTPDPFPVVITSGGSLNVPAMDLSVGCVGFATATPDYIVEVSGAMKALSFYNEAEGDTGLVINDPNGNWHCDDDSHTGTNPMVSLSNAPSGQYDIWVTSYTASDNINGTLYITERRD